MERPSLALTIIIVFWVGYIVIAAYVHYQASAPVHRELLMILGGFGILVAIATGALWLTIRPKRSTDDRS